jgi:hypothetical protein
MLIALRRKVQLQKLSQKKNQGRNQERSQRLRSRNHLHIDFIILQIGVLYLETLEGIWLQNIMEIIILLNKLMIK